MTITIGGYVGAPNPTFTYTRSNRQIGTGRRALAGGMVGRFTALKLTWSVQWSGLSESDRSDIMTQLSRLEHIAWTPVEGPAYTVRVVSGQSTPTPGGESCYDVSAELEQV